MYACRSTLSVILNVTTEQQSGIEIKYSGTTLCKAADRRRWQSGRMMEPMTSNLSMIHPDYQSPLLINRGNARFCTDISGLLQ